MTQSTKYNTLVLKEVINRNFTFADLSPRFKNVDSSTGNIFCPFHENHDTPAAKMYWDEDKEIWVIWCFSEHKHFTAYDYVNLILCEKYEKYKSPLHFLKENVQEAKLNIQLNLYQQRVATITEEFSDAKKDYIDSVFAQTGNITDFIEKLFTS